MEGSTLLLILKQISLKFKPRGINIGLPEFKALWSTMGKISLKRMAKLTKYEGLFNAETKLGSVSRAATQAIPVLHKYSQPI